MMEVSKSLLIIRRVRPDLYSAFNPWDRITTPDAVHKLFADACVRQVEVVAEEGYQALRAPEDFWTIALGSGLRWTIDQMGSETARGVKQEILNTLSAGGVDRKSVVFPWSVMQRSDRSGMLIMSLLFQGKQDGLAGSVGGLIPAVWQ